MLVLSRRRNEELIIGSDVRVRVLAVGRGAARLGILAPDAIHIRRAELPGRHPRRGSRLVTMDSSRDERERSHG